MRKRPFNLERYVLKLLSFRPRSQYEIERKLVFKGVSQKDIDDIIAKLKKANLVNDYEFAGAWIRNRALLKPKGKRMLALELRQKGISRDIIDEILGFGDDTELELACQAIDSKNRIYANLDPYEKKQKQLSFLSRRGFSYTISKAAIEKLEN